MGNENHEKWADIVLPDLKNAPNDAEMRRLFLIFMEAFEGEVRLNIAKTFEKLIRKPLNS